MPETGANEHKNAYCLFCRTGGERGALAYLRELPDVEAYFPVRQLHELHNGEWVSVERALLPGYVFVFADEKDEPYLRAHPDVLRILEYANKQRALAGGDLAFAQWLRKNQGVIGVSKAYKENQRVKILSGPLADYQGKIIRVDTRKRRALIEMEFAGSLHRVSLSFEYLEDEEKGAGR